MRVTTAWFATMLLAGAAVAAPTPAVTTTAGQKESWVVAPVVQTRGGEEYAWIGHALAERLNTRLERAPRVVAFSGTMWAAALGESDVEAPAVRGRADALGVARTLGARNLLYATYEPSWPSIRVHAVRCVVRAAVSGSDDSACTEAAVDGDLERLADVEEALAQKLFAEWPETTRTPIEPRALMPWRAQSLCRSLLSLQSLGPRARLALPKASLHEAQRLCGEARALAPTSVEPAALEALADLLVALANEDEGRRATDAARAERLRTGASQVRADATARLVRASTYPEAPALVALGAFFAGFSGATTDEARRAAEAPLVGWLKNRPAALHARLVLAEAYRERGDLVAAEALLRTMLSEVPGAPWLQVEQGKTLARANRHEEAIALTRQALENVPEDPVVLLELGSRYIDAGRYGDAEPVLRRALERAPRMAALYVRLGYVYLATDQRLLARAILHKALVEADLPSESRVKGYAHFDLAKLHAREGRTNLALEQVRAALDAGIGPLSRFQADPDLQALLRDPRTVASLQGPVR